MILHIFKNIIYSAMIIFAAFSVARADGMLIPVPPHPYQEPIIRPEPVFSVKYHNVKIEIDDQTVRTSIDQVFKNESGVAQEGIYLFPIPEKSAITGFSMYVNGEKTAGRLLGKDEARKIYEDIVRRQKDPGLLEYAGRDLFKASVYPIEPYGEKRIEISYQEVVTGYEDTFRYIYPLNTERFSAKPIASVTVVATIHTSSPIKNIYSPSHQVSIRRKGNFDAEVTYEVSNSKPDRDFELYYSVSRDDVGLTLLTHTPGNEDGYFLLLASPRFEVEKGKIQPKDLLFVFDRTGSMSGEKIEQARKALEFCLRSLNREDRFNVIPFNESPDPLFPKPVAASSENIEKALDLASSLQALGGTNIDTALETALPMASDRTRPSYLLFLTDGLPTVGETDIARIIENARTKSSGKLRFFVFGVGYDVNTHLLDRLSSDHNGTSVYVKPGEDLEVRVSNMFRMISDPVLTDVKIDYGSMGAYDIVPLKMPDLFRGSQIVTAGRFRKTQGTTVRMTGMSGGKDYSFTLKKDISGDKTHPFIPTLWASRRIGVLIDEIRLHGKKDELVEEIVRLSRKYGIITEYTSFLVEEPGGFARPMESSLHTASDNLAIAKKAESGRWAVDQSVNMQLMSQSENMAAAPIGQYMDKEGQTQKVTNVQNANDRAFYLDNNVWKDSHYDEKNIKKIIKIQNFSPAQFALLEKLPGLGAYFAKGDSVLVAISPDVAIQTSDDGKTALEEKELEEILEENVYISQ